MATYALPFVGERDFEPTPDNYWRFTVKLPAEELIIIVTSNGGSLAEGLKRADALFTSIDALDQAARSAIRAEYSESPSTSAFFVRFFTERYESDDICELFGTESDDVGVDQLLRALQLKCVRYNLAQGALFLAVEFTLAADESEQRLVVYFDSDGTVETVTMES